MKNSKDSIKGRIFILFDILIICLSLLISWLIRSQFEYFFYGISKFIFLFPWVLFSRLFFHFFFEIYSFSFATLRNNDISRIFKYNVITSLILLFFRIIRPGSDLLIMPYSMIAMEYLFSTFGFIVIRLFFYSKRNNLNKVNGYRRKIILWSEVYDIKNYINIGVLSKKYNVDIVGIINSNPLDWNNDYRNIRVFGDEKEIINISADDDTVSTIAIFSKSELTKSQKKSIIETGQKLHMDFAVIDNDLLKMKSFEWIDENL